MITRPVKLTHSVPRKYLRAGVRKGWVKGWEVKGWDKLHDIIIVTTISRSNTSG